MRKLCFLLIALLTASAAFSDPIEGKWLGTVGDELERVQIGFEFKTDDKGALQVFVYQPVINLYGLPLSIAREGDKYTIREFGASLSLKDEKLEGTIAGRLPTSLQRTTNLPSDPPVPDLPRGPSPSWKTPLGAALYAPVVLRDGVAYVGTTGGVLNAVKIKDGAFDWTFSAGRPIFGGALVTDDAVYFTCDNGQLFKLDRKTGKELFRYDLGDALVPRILPHQLAEGWDNRSPAPVISGGVIYVGSGDGSLHAVNAATGKRVWRFATGDKIRTDALVVGPNVIIGSLDKSVYAINRETGQQVWKKELRGEVTANPVLVDNRIVVGTRGIGMLFALEPVDGATAWRSLFWGSWVESAAVPYGDRFYIGASDLRRVSCYDPKSGRVIWRTDVYGWTWGLPAVTDKFVYAGVAGGSPYVIRHVPSLTAIERATGKIAWRWIPPATDALQSGFPAGPAIEGKTLVIGSLDGTLYAFPIS